MVEIEDDFDSSVNKGTLEVKILKANLTADKLPAQTKSYISIACEVESQSASTPVCQTQDPMAPEWNHTLKLLVQSPEDYTSSMSSFVTDEWLPQEDDREMAVSFFAETTTGEFMVYGRCTVKLPVLFGDINKSVVEWYELDEGRGTVQIESKYFEFNPYSLTKEHSQSSANQASKDTDNNSDDILDDDADTHTEGRPQGAPPKEACLEDLIQKWE